MPSSRFFNKKSESITLKEIIDITGATLSREVDLNIKVSDITTLQLAQSDEISFLNSAQYLDKFLTSKAGFCFMVEKNVDQIPATMVGLIHRNPYFCYSQIVEALYEVKPVEFSEKLIADSAQIGEGTIIAPNAYIGNNVVIGKNCVVAPSASILEGCVIGDNCVINSNATVSFAIIGDNVEIFNGARIGQDGFGFAHNAGVNHKILQLGAVQIGDNVSVGSNSCIDRGAIEDTIIGEGVKLDNMVQIAHNVVIGKGSVIAGCTAVAGSVKIGNFVQIGGNASISGHIEIGDGVKVAGMSGVTRSAEPMSALAGIPAVPIRKWHKMHKVLLNMTNVKK